ncbi:hypothetical protein HIM_04078 [Hirsutella minnesotensis 3608]|uniref:Sodium/calcium exchanger membrane region domain-containing protein n=1 Tax=Hirsutella minnesotensis 3608 TaxID=1043627 RepID=A0A0F8A256_9HYPO|nr:hypothetical protein HIM_04078 [Hirsutella minnesotensis 3608]
MQPPRIRGSHLRSRPFCVSVAFISLLAAFSFLARSRYQLRDGPQGRASAMFRRDETECSRIHLVSDQCAFARKHCMDADAGLLPYIEFYYCTLQHAQPVAFILLVIWLGLLFTTIGIAASDFFSVNLSTIASILGLSQSLAGVTFLAFGNGSPDVFSTFAAMSSNSPSMAVGELLGAASFIAGVVAGSMALVREFRVDRKTYTRDICFFIVAVGFTMSFLADGHLRFWECWAMVGYYVVYVVTVVSWHWYSVRRRRRLRREGEARSHFYGMTPQSGDELAGEPYRDDIDDVDRAPGQPPAPTIASHGDALSLEGGARVDVENQDPEASGNGIQEDSDEDHERMVAAEVTRNMRLLRTGAKRHHSINPIRPSLVGALEFRSAMAQLQREGNLQLSSISGRSYSDYPQDARARRGTVGIYLNTGNEQGETEVISPVAPSVARRDRALSSGDAPLSSEVIPELADDASKRVELAPSLPIENDNSQREPAALDTHAAADALAAGLADQNNPDAQPSRLDGPGRGPVPKLTLQVPSPYSFHSEMSSPRSPFPRYSESPMAMTPGTQPDHFLLPPPVAGRREERYSDLQVPVPPSSPVRWWPYSVLPPPHVLSATLFPTLQGWKEKSHWDRFLSATSVPSIFLLVITLPVVDTESSEDNLSINDTFVDTANHRGPESLTPRIAVVSTEAEQDQEQTGCASTGPRCREGRASRGRTCGSLAVPQTHETAVESTDRLSLGQVSISAKAASDAAPSSDANDDPASWNRWLLSLQLFTGPLFATFILWATLREDWDRPGRELLRMTLYTLLVSVVLLVVLLLTTTERARPRFYYLFCFLGFITSIAWISTIAGEVVGVLKAFGIILDISEALLGLTIFAAGNSIGDLVANITVARLGYPVMALSACFGGPMLNILLGIGIGGVMMMIQHANRKHKKHPGRPIAYGPYRVQVGGTLMISSITLLIILLLLLVLVPMNKWILSRKIGWLIISLWALSTAVSVVVEVTGLLGEAS